MSEKPATEKVSELQAQKDIIKESGLSMVHAEIAKLEKLASEPIPQDLSKICSQLVKYLESALQEVADQGDLSVLRSDTEFVAGLLRLFHASSEQRSSWWARPLLRHCYRQLGLDFGTRTVLIIHSDQVHIEDLNEFHVYPDLLNVADKKYGISDLAHIDVFILPLEARHDLASMALVAHEIGHVFSDSHRSEIDKLVNADRVYQNISDEGDFPAKGPPATPLRTTSKASKRRSPPEEDLIDKIERLKWEKELYKRKEALAKKVASKTEEYACDDIGRRLLGAAFDFSLIKHLLPFSNGVSAEVGQSDHPRDEHRIAQSWSALQLVQESAEQQLQDSDDRLALRLLQSITSIAESFRPLLSTLPDETKIVLSREDQLAKTFAKEFIEANDCLPEPPDLQCILTSWRKVVPELDAFRPPFETCSNADLPEIISPPAALIGATLYYHGKAFVENEFYVRSKKPDDKKTEFLRDRLVEHVSYAISLHDFVALGHERFTTKAPTTVSRLEGTIWLMRSRRVLQGVPAPVVITPSTDPVSQYGHNAVDLRLGPTFLFHRAPSYTHIEPCSGRNSPHLGQPLREFYEETYRYVGKRLIVHPHQFVLAATLEYISLPPDFYALVLGRSTGLDHNSVHPPVMRPAESGRAPLASAVVVGAGAAAAACAR
jgi:hypothetical protein